MFIDLRERETSIWERNINWMLAIHALTGDQTHNLDMSPDWESNPQILVCGTMLQPTEPLANDELLFNVRTPSQVKHS